MPGSSAPCCPTQGAHLWATSSISLQAAWALGLGSGLGGERGHNLWPHQTLEGGWMDGVGSGGTQASKRGKGKDLSHGPVSKR